MKEISLNILDIAENSVKAKAKNINISILETNDYLIIEILDDGTGMTDEILQNVTDPFCTTRTTRNVGLGIPLLKLSAEQTGGNVEITSKHFSKYPDNHGTKTVATFFKNHIDMTPLGDIISTISTLIHCNPDIDFVFSHKISNKEVTLNTKELRNVLGPVPLNNTEVNIWIKEYLSEQYKVS